MASPLAPEKSLPAPELIRGIGLSGATALNMIDMIGVGPFITIPLIVAAMGGPQAMLGWVCGALLVICDGLVWAELGAAMPGSGGSYGYLKEIYNPNSAGKLMAFLFIWQLTFSAPLSIASGCIGLAQYSTYLVPGLGGAVAPHDFHFVMPFIWRLEASFVLTPGTVVAMGCRALAAIPLLPRVTMIGGIAKLLWARVIG